MSEERLDILIFSAAALILLGVGFIGGVKFACWVAIEQGAAHRDANGDFHWSTEGTP